jgi:hypothetical protein
MRLTLSVLFLLASPSLWLQADSDSQKLTPEVIMARVAANQDRAEKLRSEYVYKQHIHVISRKTNGKLMREETTDFDVVPQPQGTQRQLKQIAGKYLLKGKYLTYSSEPAPDIDSLDGDLVHDFREDLTNDKSKDGMGKDLFPLTTAEQTHYQFRLLGEQMANGRAVYRIWFSPKDKTDFDWAGEALIDKEDFQPVNVYTKLSKKLPFFVRTMLGTDLPGIGFNVTYKRQSDGVWFPVSFGTEFRLRAVFFINRDLSISLQNSGFEHTHVDSKIDYSASVR